MPSAVDQKRSDALELLARLAHLDEEAHSRPPANWSLEPTVPFVELQRWAEGQPALLSDAAATAEIDDARFRLATHGDLAVSPLSFEQHRELS